MARVRPFSTGVLEPYASSIALNPFRGKCWKHMLLVPLYELPFQPTEGVSRVTVFDVQDRDTLEQAFTRHLGGYTKENRENAPLFMGIGWRGSELERNVHALYLVYTKRSRRAWKYVLKLVEELQECTDEEQILFEQTDAFIAGVPRL